MEVITEMRLRDLLSKGTKRIVIGKDTIITPAARDLARESGVSFVISTKEAKRDTEVKEEKKCEEEIAPDECSLDSESNEDESNEDSGSKSHKNEDELVGAVKQHDDLIAKVKEITREKLGDNPISEEVVSKVLSILRKHQPCLNRANLLARSTGGKGVVVTLPSGTQCALGLISLVREETWKCPDNALFLVATGKIKVLPSGVFLAAGDGYQAEAGCQVEAVNDSTFFCLQAV
ncbi:MAG: hypothetical protein ACPLTR_07965 [Thermacetogeniaceae bacterium]